MTLTELLLLHERMTCKILQLILLFSSGLEAWVCSEGRSQEPHLQSYKSSATSEGILKNTVLGVWDVGGRGLRGVVTAWLLKAWNRAEYAKTKKERKETVKEKYTTFLSYVFFNKHFQQPRYLKVLFTLGLLLSAENRPAVVAHLLAKLIWKNNVEQQ